MDDIFMRRPVGRCAGGYSTRDGLGRCHLPPDLRRALA